LVSQIEVALMPLAVSHLNVCTLPYLSMVCLWGKHDLFITKHSTDWDSRGQKDWNHYGWFNTVWI